MPSLFVIRFALSSCSCSDKYPRIEGTPLKKNNEIFASGKKFPRREEDKKERGFWWEIAILVVRDEFL